MGKYFLKVREEAFKRTTSHVARKEKAGPLFIGTSVFIQADHHLLQTLPERHLGLKEVGECVRRGMCRADLSLGQRQPTSTWAAGQVAGVWHTPQVGTSAHHSPRHQAQGGPQDNAGKSL